MLYRSSSLVSAHRRGVVLLVVMALLALFAAVGLSFVFYADGEAFASKIGAQAIVKEMPEVDPEDLAAFFLNQMIYGTNNQYSALRGWDLARSMYGYNPYALNFTPYNGEGRASFAPPTTNDPNLGIPMFNVINYQTFWSETQAANLDVVRTPEFYGSAKFAKAAGPPPYTYQSAAGTYRYVGGANAPWTAYDTNSLWLAQVAADGTVLTPSFGRPWLANAVVPGPTAKYMSVFIDPTWNTSPNGSFYPLPDADQQVGTALPPQVKNLEIGPGMLQPNGLQGVGPYFNNDSYWIDMGFPVMTAPNGKRYKALVAPLVMDLSNKLNLWANGNRVAGTAAAPSNASNQGYGPPEVNLARVLGVPIISAVEKNAKVTITTATPHGLQKGQEIIVNVGIGPGVAAPAGASGYNGPWAVTSAPTTTTFTYTATTTGLPGVAGSATAPVGLAMPVAEAQNLRNFVYGGATGTTASGPLGPLPIKITNAKWAAGTDLATITTNGAHGLGVGQRIFIAGVSNAQYNGLFNIAAVPSTTQFQFYYSPPNGGALGGGANGTVVPVPNIRWGNFGSYVSANGLNAGAAGSSAPQILPFLTTTLAAVAKGNQTVKFAPGPSPLSPFPPAIQKGMALNVGIGAAAEPVPVIVTAVNYAVTPPTFAAKFTKNHAAGSPITFSPTAAYPTFAFSPGWGDTPATVAPQLVNSPLMLNLWSPTNPNMPPLPMTHQEALLRYGGTNSPALTSEIFRRMPWTLSNPRSRMMTTLASWDFDRITSSPYVNVNTATTPPYEYASGSYPYFGVNEVQTITVTGAPGETFTLTYNGQNSIPLNFGATAAQVQSALQSLAAIGPGNAVVTATVVPPTATYTVTFADKLGNQSLAKIVGASTNGARVTTAVTRTGIALATFNAAPNFGNAATYPKTPNSDYIPNDFRSILSQNLRVDLTRPLTDYPPPAPGTGLINIASAQYLRAVADRQQFARDIYNALVRATGARDPNKIAGMVATNPDYQAARWLAQLAVNIVDYIDNDDYMTPFPWNINNPTEILFGTELPRLVLNEAYAQQESSATPAANAGVGGVNQVGGGQVNVWAELLNPFNSYPAGSYSWSPQDNGAALLRLSTAANAPIPYTIEMHASGPALTAALSAPYNPMGAGITPLSIQNTWGNIPTTMQVPPVNGLKSGGTIEAFTIDPIPAKNNGTFGATAVGTKVTITTKNSTLTAADVGKAITINGVPVAGYDGTFVITGVNVAKKSFTYTAVTGGMASSGGGIATFVKTDNPAAGNNGFYVIAPSSATYPATVQGVAPANAPNLPATYASPSMSFNAPMVAINKITHVGNTVTVQLAGALPTSFATGESVIISSVTAPLGKGTTPASYNNSAAGNPVTWTITATTANTFTFTYTGTAALPAPGVAAGTAATGGTATLSFAINTSGGGGITLLLRRLANPHAPYQPLPTNPITYNPYITVDYLNQVPVNLPTAAQSTALYQTVGRSQPYAANSSFTNVRFPQYAQYSGTAPQAGPALNAPQNTFFSQNSNAPLPPLTAPTFPGMFDWLVHLDRPPVNVIELLNVSGFRPHELTQNFVAPNPVTGAPVKFQHYAPWNPFAASPASATLTMADPNAMIYRALDQFSTTYMAGTTFGGRRPGLVNINTVTEPEVFVGVCDPHDPASANYPNPWFTQSDAANVFQLMMGARQLANPALPAQLAGEGTPFKSFSAASTLQNQVGFGDTLFRSPAGTGQPLFIPPSLGPLPSATAHPYWQASLLQKIYNNVTTTSNVFAIWWTVGYFEVVDESVMPPRLGQEIGRSQNRHIRHRFFAVVDRSGLQIASTTSNTVVQLATPGKTPLPTVPQSATITINVNNVVTQNAGTPSGVAPAWSATQPYLPGNIVTYKGAAYYYIGVPNGAGQPPATTPTAWQNLIQVGMLLEVDTGDSAEVVTVTAANGAAVTANFTKSHNVTGVATPMPIVIRGNPGPQAGYNPRHDSNVVLHLSVIK